jgi:integrase
LNGRRRYLSRDFQVAKRKLLQLLARKPSKSRLPDRDWWNATFAELADEYLDDIQATRARGTYRNNRERLARALASLGVDVRISELRRLHLTRLKRHIIHKYSNATVRDTIGAVQAALNWAVENEMLDFSPLQKFKKPKAGGRNRLVRAHEFQQLLRHSDACFRRFLVALRATGCRPGELRSLTWEMVSFEEGLWVIPKHKTITMQEQPAPRVIPLPIAILKLCRWLAGRQHGLGDYVFLNQRGRPYTKDCLVRTMDRVRRRAGIERLNGENLVLYSHRHAFATAAIGQVSDTELAELMGHSTTRTLRRYVHLNSKHLHQIRRRIQRVQ